MKVIMPEDHQPKQSPELGSQEPEKMETSARIPQPSVAFRTVPNLSEEFGKVPQVAERHENHTLTVRETARLFEAAGAARTERSIINWCQLNRQGIARLDSYYDPNERKYYITPQSVEAVIQEEIQRSKKSGEATNSEGFGSAVTHVKHSTSHDNRKTDGARKIEELERTVNDLKLSNQVKDLFIELLKNERAQVFDIILLANRPTSQLTAELNQSGGALGFGAADELIHAVGQPPDAIADAKCQAPDTGGDSARDVSGAA